jgi:hypothetical protein
VRFGEGVPWVNQYSETFVRIVSSEGVSSDHSMNFSPILRVRVRARRNGSGGRD